MNSKLILTIEQSVLKKAEKYAKDQDRSLSELIENYLKTLTTNVSQNQIELTPLIKSLKGSFIAPDNFNYKKELVNSLAEKHP